MSVSSYANFSLQGHPFFWKWPENMGECQFYFAFTKVWNMLGMTKKRVIIGPILYRQC